MYIHTFINSDLIFEFEPFFDLKMTNTHRFLELKSPANLGILNLSNIVTPKNVQFVYKRL